MAFKHFVSIWTINPGANFNQSTSMAPVILETIVKLSYVTLIILHYDCSCVPFENISAMTNKNMIAILRLMCSVIDTVKYNRRQIQAYFQNSIQIIICFVIQKFFCLATSPKWWHVSKKNKHIKDLPLSYFNRLHLKWLMPCNVGCYVFSISKEQKSFCEITKWAEAFISSGTLWGMYNFLFCLLIFPQKHVT